MRKLIFTLLMFVLAFSVSAQDMTVKFLGIPVDGTQKQMISQLKRKGYKLCKDPKLAEYKALEGSFNGRDVHIYVVANNNKVYRIVVQDVKTINEADIKIRYNTLVSQFQNNGNYYYDTDVNQYLDDDFDVSYEMSVNNNRIQASYTQKCSKDEIEALLNKYPSIKETSRDAQDLFIKMCAYTSNTVWFMISRLDNSDDYWIALFYDNLNNAPNGEDL